MLDEMKGEMRRSASGAKWSGHLVISGRTVVLNGVIAEDGDGKYLQLVASVADTPINPDRMRGPR